MRTCGWIALASAILLSAGPAFAGVINGDFSAGSVGWDLMPDSDPEVGGLALAEIVPSFSGSDNVLHLAAATQYQWLDGEWIEDYQSSVTASPSAGFTLEPGQQALSFWAASQLEGGQPANQPQDEAVKVTLRVVYKNSDPNGPMFLSASTLIQGSWSQYELLLPGVDISMSPILQISAENWLSPEERLQEIEGQTRRTVAAEAWFDNFATTVPEPATMGLLTLMSVGLLRRRS